MDTFNIIGRNFWLISLLVGLQAFWKPKEVRERCLVDAEFAAADKSIRLRMFFWMNLPWLAMGIGQVIGGVPAVWNYLNPYDGNPWVMSFFFTVFVCWFVLAYWIYFSNGANTVVEHKLIRINGITGQISLTPSIVKLVVALVLIGGIAGVTMMFKSHFPMPARLI